MKRNRKAGDSRVDNTDERKVYEHSYIDGVYGSKL